MRGMASLSIDDKSGLDARFDLHTLASILH